MEEITFSVFNHGKNALEVLQELLTEFERKFRIHVWLEVISTWALGWSRLVENALYRSGPDVSEAGNRWIGDLARMEALVSFTRKEGIEIINQAKFFDSVWESKIDEGQDDLIHSILWTCNTRAVFYRHDLLDKAGISEASAFKDINQFEETISRLRSKTPMAPLSLTMRRSSLTIHNIASWIWNSSGDFLSKDGTQLEFNKPNANDGCKAYFRLGNYLEPQYCNLEEDQANALFRSGKAAVEINGPWMVNSEEMSPVLRDNIGVLPMAGTPFVGGQDLVVWIHSKLQQAGIKLIRFLHSEEAEHVLFPLFGLPVKMSTWDNAPFSTGYYPVFKSAIQNGRGFEGKLWGLVEKRLTDEYADIWADLLNNPVAQHETIIESHITNLANRLQLSIGS